MSVARIRAAVRLAKPLRLVHWAGGDHPELRGPLVNRPVTLRLIRCLEGNADHWINDGHRVRRIDLPPGTALLAPPGHPLRGGDHPAQMANLLIDGDTVLLRHFHRPGTRPTIARGGAAAAPVAALAKALLARGQRPPDDPLLLATVELLWRHACELLAEVPREAIPARDAFTAACRLVDEDLAGELGRDAVAHAVGVHPNHLSRLFQRACGMGFERWVAERRLERAQRLIRAGLCPLGEAGLAVGFSSPAVFSQVCRRLRGHPPGQL